MTEHPVKSQRQVAETNKRGYNQIMSRRDKIKAIQEAYSKWEEGVKFTSETGASDEDEAKVMDEISTILKGNKPEQ